MTVAFAAPPMAAKQEMAADAADHLPARVWLGVEDRLPWIVL